MLQLHGFATYYVTIFIASLITWLHIEWSNIDWLVCFWSITYLDLNYMFTHTAFVAMVVTSKSSFHKLMINRQHCIASALVWLELYVCLRYPISTFFDMERTLLTALKLLNPALHLSFPTACLSWPQSVLACLLKDHLPRYASRLARCTLPLQTISSSVWRLAMIGFSLDRSF